jgi:fucose permease
MAPAPPFPAFVLGYFINGVGVAFQVGATYELVQAWLIVPCQDSQANGYVAALKYDGATKMGILHAIYGFGAFASPLIATQFASAKHWSFHFFASMGLSVSTAILLLIVFRGRTQNGKNNSTRIPG